jgi:hypothetical protein
MFNRCRLPGCGLAVEKLYVKESDCDQSNNSGPENQIRDIRGFAFPHQNVGGRYQQDKVTEEHPEGSYQKGQYSTLLINWLVGWGRHNASPKKSFNLIYLGGGPTTPFCLWSQCNPTLVRQALFQCYFGTGKEYLATLVIMI